MSKVSGLKLSGVAGVTSKVETFRYDDPKFAQIEPTITGSTRTISENVINTNGVSSPLTNRSTEGYGIGGYDPKFNVL